MSALRLIEAARKKFDIQILSLVSDTPSIEVCKKYGIDGINTVAHPLGTKMNTGIDFILKNYQFDYLLKIDDDDVCDSRLLDIYTPYIKQRVPYFGIKTIYFLHARTRNAIYFKYPYNTAKLFGPGKMLLREALERTGYKTKITATRDIAYHAIKLNKGVSAVIPTYQAEYLDAMGYAVKCSGSSFQLYNDSQTRSLDYISEMNLLFNGYHPVEVVTDKPVFTDVKTDVNIWTFDNYSHSGKKVALSEATAFWSAAEINHLKNLL
jgi:hypothetical protein